MNKNEYKALKRDKNKYSYEGIAWYASDSKTETPIYRLYNKQTGQHLFTANKNEFNHLIKKQKKTWKAEGDKGIAWYELA